MLTKQFKFWIVLLVAILPVLAQATHNRAGEITYEQIGPLTIRVTVTTYTKTSSISADRDSLTVFWGDGTESLVGRVNGNGEELPNNIKKNLYIKEHSYPGRGTYTISMIDPNRTEGIINVNEPNSVNVPFYLETVITLLNAQFQGRNNSAQLLQPPIDIACVGQRFIHNPNAFDPDGDSLAYELITPMVDANNPVPRYMYPDQINPGINNQIFFDETTGDFIWESPQREGDYNIAILIKEYRNGTLINTIIRDMQIKVLGCNNMPPIIDDIEEICTVAGELVEFKVTATDPDVSPIQRVQITAYGSPFEVSISPAELIGPQGFQEQPAEVTFRWQTTCEHISSSFYKVIFRASDNFYDTTGLVDLKTIFIKVSAPPPLDPIGEADGGQVMLSWEYPYRCQDAADDYFQGFSVWRRDGSKQIDLDTCNPGLDPTLYEKINFLTRDTSGGRYVFTDQDVSKGKTYCYRILAEFAQLTDAGYPFNRVESLRSDEVCVQLARDIPLITHVDVESTDPSSGIIRVDWVRPLATDLDTLMHQGPYAFELWRAEGINATDFQKVPGAFWQSQHFATLLDSSFTDSGLNTRDRAYRYRIAFYTGNSTEVFGYSEAASSIYLNLLASDRMITLVWDERIPWENYQYSLFRGRTFGGPKDSIDLVTSIGYEDKTLINGENYCYLVKAYGSYGLAGITSPQINFSQEVCASPIDTVAPCPPLLELSNNCETAGEYEGEEFIENKLVWSDPRVTCPEATDLASFCIYYATSIDDEFVLIDSFRLDEGRVMIHKPEGGSISGCYAITSKDSLGNESPLSNIECSEDCPKYSLPNSFTPNGDGHNELFVPFPYRFIDKIDIKIFNRWGQLVYETEDPDIQWDGKDLNGIELAEAVYYYRCIVYGFSASDNAEIVFDKLSGSIHLIR